MTINQPANHCISLMITLAGCGDQDPDRGPSSAGALVQCLQARERSRGKVPMLRDPRIRHSPGPTVEPMAP